MSQRLLLIPEKQVIGNLARYPQTYSFEYLPQQDDLPPKLSLNVRADVFNSIRFMHMNSFEEFVEDAFIAMMVMKEMRAKPIAKEPFRIANLEGTFERIKKRLVDEWKKGAKVEYQK